MCRPPASGGADKRIGCAGREPPPATGNRAPHCDTHPYWAPSDHLPAAAAVAVATTTTTTTTTKQCGAPRRIDSGTKGSNLAASGRTRGVGCAGSAHQPHQQQQPQQPQQQQQQPQQPQPKLRADRNHNGLGGRASGIDKTNLDSGYAWLILAIMFLLQSSISGTFRVYGLIYAKQVDIGHYDRQQASWPIATASAIENLASILTPALVRLFSWRQIELTAGCLFVISNFATYFSQSLALDVLFLGCVQGIALSMSTVLSLAINNDYFERYRTTAYGISMAGSTFGVLYLSPLVSWLLDTFDDFRLAYLALAGVFCFNVLLAVFIKPRAQTIGRRPLAVANRQRAHGVRCSIGASSTATVSSSSSSSSSTLRSAKWRRARDLNASRLSESTASTKSVGDAARNYLAPPSSPGEPPSGTSAAGQCSPGAPLAANGAFGSNLKLSVAAAAAAAHKLASVGDDLDTDSADWARADKRLKCDKRPPAVCVKELTCDHSKGPATDTLKLDLWRAPKCDRASRFGLLAPPAASTTGGGNCASRLACTCGDDGDGDGTSTNTDADTDTDTDNSDSDAATNRRTCARRSIASLSDWATERRWSAPAARRRKRRRCRRQRRAQPAAWWSQVALPVWRRPSATDAADDYYYRGSGGGGGATAATTTTKTTRPRAGRDRRESAPFFTQTSGAREHSKVCGGGDGGDGDEGDGRLWMRLGSDVSFIVAGANGAREIILDAAADNKSGSIVLGRCEKFSDFRLDPTTNGAPNGEWLRRNSAQQRPAIVSADIEAAAAAAAAAAIDSAAHEQEDDDADADADAEFNLRTIGELMRSPYLHLTWLMLSLYYMVARVFAIILVDFALDHAVEPIDARALLNYWSLGELCGRLLLGSLIDLRWMGAQSCVALTCLLLAASILAMVLFESYALYALCSALVAALISLEYMLINVLLVESMGERRVTGCYALAALVSSAILFARPMLIGLFRDSLGSYDGLLLLLAASSLFVALLFALAKPLCGRCWRRTPSDDETPATRQAA